jgi:myo-inositol-hexaphosphate 3-phosphohydrolase
VYHLVTIVPKGLKIALANHVRTHDPDASIGRKPEEIAVNSERRLKAISMYQLGYTQTYIASVLKVSASRVSAILRAYKRALHAIAAADTPYCPIPVSADYKKDHS